MVETQRSQHVLADAVTVIHPKSWASAVLGDGVELQLGRLHEVLGEARDVFACLAAAKLTGPVIWIRHASSVASLTPTGLQDFINPSRIITVACLNRQEVLWSGEQSLRTKGADLVVIDIDDGPDLRESRRLQIAAEETGALGVALIGRTASSSAAQTRWVCNADPSEGGQWLWKRVKDKNGRIGAWRVHWSRGSNASGFIHLAAAAAA